jgi:RHS repeat-associated protein
LQPFQPFYGYIQCLSAWGIIGGYGDATFRPAASVTRGQIAKILSNSADLDADVSGMRTFQDVLPGDPFWGFAEQLAAQGAINGYPCGGPGEPCGQGDLPYFRPGNNATRGQIAKMTTLTSDLTDPVADGQQTFQDVPPGQPFWLPIEQLTRRGVINGYPCGGPGEPCGPGDLPYFRSGNNASRGQLSKITSLLFFPGCVWSAPSGPTDDEMLGGGNPSEGSTTGRAGVNVNTATGNFWYSATDFAVPGRGPGLLLTRTYNVQAASVNGRFGFGWTDSYNMYIEGLATSNLIVHQENGSTLPFTFGNAAYLHDPRVLAELVHNSVGSYSLTRTQGQMRFLFDELGKLAQVRDRNHYVTSLSYAGARLASVQDPAGRRLLFTYDSKGRVTTVQDPSGNRHASYTYDTRGNLGSVTDVTGHITRFTYDDNHRMETITDPKGGVLQNSYGAMYRVKSQVGPGCRVYDFTYATSGNHVVTTITDPRSIVSVHTHTSGRLTKVVEDARGAAPATWRYGYRAGYISGLAMVVDPNGHVWRATWNPQGDRLTATDPLGHTTTATYNATHDLLALTNPLGLTTSYVPDTAGNLLSVSRPLVPPDQVTTLYTYDPTHPGDLIAATDPDGHTWQFTYHPVSGNRLTSTNPLNQTTYYTYDGVGRILSSTTPLGHVTIYTYNAYGDLLTLTDPLGHTTRYTYDGNRHIVAVQDANGHVTLTTYDLANQRVRETRPDLTYSDYAYDADGNLVRQTNSLGQSTLYVYDPFNRLIDSSDALHRITHYRYDSAGRWISTIDSASPPRTTSYAYDNANRLTSISYSDGTTPNVSYSYDPAGRRTSMRDGTGTTSYTYDSLDRLTQEANGASQAVTYGYDLRGNTLNVGYPGGRTVQYDYDPANRMTSLNDGDSRTTQFTYDLDGNLSAHLYPNNTRVDMTYDLAGRLASTAHSHNGTTFLSLGYTRDSMGLLQGLADSVAGPRTYAYDGLDRLTGDTAGASDTRTWDYDGAYRITGSSTMAGGVQWTTIRGYGATDELSTLVETQTGSPTRNLGFTYNSVGDRVSQTDSANGPTTYNYDQVSRLTGYTRGASTTYAYNGDGLRMSKSVGGGASEQFTWDTRSSPPRLFAAGQDAYIWGPSDLLVERLASRVPYFYHLDQQGSTRALTDLSGNVAAAASYDPYGGPPGGSGKLGPFGYVGAYRDAESDLLYLGDRYYDLATQQYITTGRRVPGERAYAYAADNPLNVDQPAGQLAMGPLARRDLFLFAPCTTPASALPDASCARGGTLWWETQGGPSWASTGSIWPRGNSTVLAERIAESTLPFPTWGSGSSANAIVVTADPFGWYRLPFSIKGVGSRGNSVVVTQNPMNEYTLPLPTWGRGACAVP